MRPAKVSDKELFEDLARVFRRKGYDGCSYADLMAATGLVKASLYHRFPGGKDQMVNALLTVVDRHFASYVLAPAFQQGWPRNRTRLIAHRLREFYDSGKQWCLLDTLTTADRPSTLAHARKSMGFWVDCFVRLGRESGFPAKLARKRAEEAVAAIEGSLILSRVLKNPRPFLRVLVDLPNRLTR
jgi:TetR/AcrR family transcriptional regulator, lmrAB and yxaGH operons repressor